MGRNLMDLANSLEKRSKKIKKSINEVTVKYALEVLLELVDKTPVDTSEALSNWQIGINKPVGNRIEPYFPGIQGSTQSESARAAYEAGKALLQTRRVGETIYISNLAKHIVYLNQGTSVQAAAGFVEAAVLTARKRMKNVKIKLV